MEKLKERGHREVIAMAELPKTTNSVGFSTSGLTVMR